MILPKVSFIMPTLNEERRITRALVSIRSQKYPQDRVEILIADGGSTDKTLGIAKDFKAKIFFNELRLAEPGVHLGEQKATGDICVVMAADNVLPHDDWLFYMTKPFIEDKKIIAAFTKILAAKDDSLFSQYVALLHADPFNEFIFGKAANPSTYHQLFKTLKKTHYYQVFQFSIENYPLIAMAQGFALRRQWKRKEEQQFDDILPILELVRKDVPIAYVPKAGMYHYSFSGFVDFLQKYDRRVKNALAYGFTKRSGYLSFSRRLKQYLWIPYSLSFVLPLAVCVYRMVKEHNIAYLYHPFACFSLTILIGKNFIAQKIVR